MGLMAVLVAWPACGLRQAAGQERKALVVSEWDARLDLEQEYWREETRSKDGARTVIERSIFRQLLRAGVAGYSFDPRLLRYQLNVELGYDRMNSRFDTPFATPIPKRQSSGAARLGYDILLQFFPESVVSFALWARQREYLMTQLMYDWFEVREQGYGARIDTKWPVAPMSVEVDLRDIAQRGLFENYNERTWDLLYQMRKDFSETNHLDILYEYLQVHRLTTRHGAASGRTLEDEDIQRGEIFHEYRFGPTLRSSLLSQLSVLDQKGTYPFRNILARERLILEHTPNFQTYYGLSYQKTDVGLSSVRTETVEAGLRHQLYDNFITRIEGRYRHTDETLTKWNEGDVLGNWNYRRHNPWGELFVNLLVRETRRRYAGPLGTTNLINDYFEILQELRNHVRLYYRIEDRRLNVGPQQASAITASTYQTVGYEVPWRQYTWLQEYRHLDDTLGLTDALRTGVRGIFRMPWESSLNAQLMDEEINYRGRMPTSRMLTGELDYLMPFGRTGLWEVEAIYDEQQGILNQQDYRARTSLEWQWRKLKMRFSGQYGLFENEAVQQRGAHLLFTVSREFR